MDIKEFIESDYIKASPEWEGQTVAIITEPKLDENNKFESDRLICQVEHKTDKKFLSINKTNAKILAAKWGVDTKSWVGQLLKIGTSAIAVKGEIKKMLVLTPV